MMLIRVGGLSFRLLFLCMFISKCIRQPAHLGQLHLGPLDTKQLVLHLKAITLFAAASGEALFLFGTCFYLLELSVQSG